LYRWGLNRVYGALALACLDEDRRKQLAEELAGIHLKFGSNVAERFATFEEGTLTISLYYYPGEVGCFYERDLERVLAGEAIRYEEPAAEGESGAEEESGDGADGDDTEDDAHAGMDDEAKARADNDENFRTAAASLKDNEPTWSMQLEMLFQRPIPVRLNFDSLHGDFALVQPFIHQGLTATMEALTKIAFDSARKDFAAKIQSVLVSGEAEGAPVRIEMANGALSVGVPLKIADIRPPTDAVLAALIEHSRTIQ
jgi:hypothetical protein